jgi:hypothetical protein
MHIRAEAYSKAYELDSSLYSKIKQLLVNRL